MLLLGLMTILLTAAQGTSRMVREMKVTRAEVFGQKAEYVASAGFNRAVARLVANGNELQTPGGDDELDQMTLLNLKYQWVATERVDGSNYGDWLYKLKVEKKPDCFIYTVISEGVLMVNGRALATARVEGVLTVTGVQGGRNQVEIVYYQPYDL